MNRVRRIRANPSPTSARDRLVAEAVASAEAARERRGVEGICLAAASPSWEGGVGGVAGWMVAALIIGVLSQAGHAMHAVDVVSRGAGRDRDLRRPAGHRGTANHAPGLQRRSVTRRAGSVPGQGVSGRATRGFLSGATPWPREYRLASPTMAVSG